MRTRPADHKLTMLRVLPGLERCPEEDLRALARIVDEHDVAAGEVLTVEGRAGRQAWIVLQGEAEVRRMGTLLWEASRGCLVGDLGVLGAVPCAATTAAVTDMRMLSLSPRAAETFFRHESLARWAFGQLDRRLRELTCAPTAYGPSNRQGTEADVASGRPGLVEDLLQELVRFDGRPEVETPVA